MTRSQPPDFAALKQAALNHIHRAGTHLAVHALTGGLAREQQVSRRAIRQTLRVLLQEGAIVFTSRLGTSFIEPSYQRPLRLTPRIWIAQPGRTVPSKKGDVVIYLALGDAFGDGRHATTRLALAGVEQALAGARRQPPGEPAHCLDMGTGSGILALAALALGLDLAWGIDTDPCARSEAKANARENGMAHKLCIAAAPPQGSNLKFQLITANLRLPTLCRLAPLWTRYRRPDTRLVLSGIRESEMPPLMRAYGASGWQACETDAADGWAMTIFRQ